MPTDQDFPKNHQVIGKHRRADGEHFHFEIRFRDFNKAVSPGSI